MVVELDQDQALRLWWDALAGSVRGDGPDLSARQMAILLTVYIKEGPHTVRGLAAGLNISKPAVTRALDRLAELKFTHRVKDEQDRRNVLIQRTVRGSAFLSEFAELVAAAAGGLDG
jgi:DNA-binding MarR family transcriptional regulator